MRRASVHLDGVTLGYDLRPVVCALSLAVPPGDLLAVIGPNGAGKSTLLKAMAGLLKPMAGRVRFDGCRSRDVAYLPQRSELDRSFPLPVFDFVAMGLWRRRGAFGRFRRADDEAVAGAIAAVGLAGFEERPLDALSGGQMQRVLFARLSLQDAPIILLDEPFAAIDGQTEAVLLDMIAGWSAEGRTVVAVLHDLDTVRRRFSRTLLLGDAAAVAGDTAAMLDAARFGRPRGPGAEALPS